MSVFMDLISLVYSTLPLLQISVLIARAYVEENEDFASLSWTKIKSVFVIESWQLKL